MIRNPEQLRRFEDDLIRNTPVDVARNFRLADALYEQARALGAFAGRDALEGIEVDVRVARVVNSVLRAP